MFPSPVVVFCRVVRRSCRYPRDNIPHRTEEKWGEEKSDEIRSLIRSLFGGWVIECEMCTLTHSCTYYPPPPSLQRPTEWGAGAYKLKLVRRSSRINIKWSTVFIVRRSWFIPNANVLYYLPDKRTSLFIYPFVPQSCDSGHGWSRRRRV